MRAFVYRLVERLTQEAPLSRNRNFHTFVSPEGRKALRIARRIRSVARDIAAARRPPRTHWEGPGSGPVRVEIQVLAGTRITYLDPEEWEILKRMPIVRAALGED